MQERKEGKPLDFLQNNNNKDTVIETRNFKENNLCKKKELNILSNDYKVDSHRTYLFGIYNR